MFGKYCPAYDSPVMYLANESSQSYYHIQFKFNFIFMPSHNIKQSKVECTHVSKKKVAAVASWLATIYERALMA